MAPEPIDTNLWTIERHARMPGGPVLPTRTTVVGIRGVEGGAFSTYALKELSVGDQVEAMPPMGRFVLERNNTIVAGGIIAGNAK